MDQWNLNALQQDNALMKKIIHFYNDGFYW